MNRTPIESFLDLTRKSGLVENSRLNFYLERLEQLETIPEDPKELAAILVRDSVLSRFQADQLIAGKWRGFYVGKYRVIERIGIGGIGPGLPGGTSHDEAAVCHQGTAPRQGG